MSSKVISKASSRKKLWFALIIVVCLVLAGAGYFVLRDKTDPETPTVATSVPIAITGVKVPAQTKIGIIVTFGSGNLDGTQWNQAAQGARVAQQRLALGGTDVELVTLNDQGSAEGAQNAVAALADEGVAGIIVATSGPQVEAAVTAAQDAGISTILPYESLPVDAQDSYSLYPVSEDFDLALQAAVSGYANPLLINSGEEIPSQIDIADVLTFAPGEDLTALADEVAQTTGADIATNGAYFGGEEGTDSPEGSDSAEGTEAAPVPHDAVLVSGPPELQAKIVHALQTKNIAVPIILTHGATSPGFTSALFTAGGTVAPNLVSVGTAGNESVALQKTEHGQSTSAFYAALRSFSADPEILNLSDDAPFGSVSAAADSLSHDAVLSFVKAVSAANSIAPGEVATALGTLQLGPDSGIAGLSLDFGAQSSLNTQEVEVLHATAQDLGLRGQVEEGSQSLVWFPQP